MGRLFWKFFFFLWLAQFISTFGVGIAIWSLRPEHPFPPPPHSGAFESRPPPHAEDAPRHMPPAPPPPHRFPFLPPMMPLIAGSIVSLLFAGLLAWYFSRPILVLRTALEAIAGGKLETRVAVEMGTREDELADLGKDFDRMAERLQSLIETQRHLLHDVSHELRSPLARLQAAAGLMRQQPERSAELVERIDRDTERIDRLIGELLTLARLDAGQDIDLDEEVELTELITELVEDVRFEAAHCSVTLDMKEPLVVLGNAELLHRALENVLRNAVGHSPPSGCVHVAVHRQATAVTISVTDEGPGVAEELLGQIFQPFFRGKGKAPFSGYGLGLAITRGVIEKHGGTVVATNRAAGGLALEIRLTADGRV